MKRSGTWARLLLAASLGLVGLAAPSAQAEIIHLYAKQGDVDAVRAQLDAGVPVDLPATSYTTVRGVSPLFVAAQAGQLAVVELLLARGADPSLYFWAEGTSGYAVGGPLHTATQGRQIDIVSALLDADADPDLYGYFTGPPLHVARIVRDGAIADLLIAAGAPERVEAPAIARLLHGANLARGQVLARGCVQCHGVPAPEAGQGERARNLWGIVGSTAGAQVGPQSSTYLVASGLVWTPDLLSSYLAAPYRFLPGTAKYPGAIEAEPDRADIIAYLMALSE